MSRAWDGWLLEKEKEDSFVNEVLLQRIIPIYPLVGLILGVGDTLVVNPYVYWTEDFWRRQRGEPAAAREGTKSGETREDASEVLEGPDVTAPDPIDE